LNRKQVFIFGVYCVELRHLRYFLAVAEERNVTRAAEKLGIGQPPLSQQMHALERELGVQLFRRTGHGIVLTEAGEAFLSDAKRIIEDAQHAVQKAQRTGRGETGHLSIGFTGSAAFNPLVTKLIRAFRQSFPSVQLTLTEGNTAQLLALLDEERLDVAFVRPGGQPPTGVEFYPLAEEPMKIVLPATHRLAGKRKLPLTALAEEPFVLMPREASPSLYDQIMGACRKAGFEPVLGQLAPQLSSVVNLVAAEFGVSVVPQAVCQIRVEGVVYIDLQGSPFNIRLAAAFRKNDANAKTANFLAIARQTQPQPPSAN
jgi:DNA-binding transcriptional LysR family regulator